MSRAGGVQTFDLASSAGWAYAYPGEEPRYGSHRFAPPGCTVGRFAAEFADWCDAMLALNAPRLVAYEAAILTDGNTSVDTAMKLMGLAVRCQELCHRRSIQVVKYDSSTVCKWFTGRGRYGNRQEKKSAVIRACLGLRWKPDDDDAADALALWAYACAQFAPQVPEKRWLGPLLGASA